MPPLHFSLFSRRALRPRFAGAVALAVLVTVAAACQGTKTAPPMGPPPPPNTYCAPSTPATPQELQDAFDGVREANAGYFVASDGGIPVKLPDDRTLWFFGDTVLGRWTPGGPVNPFLGLANNSWILQDGACFTPRLEPIPDPAGNEWIWPTGAVARSNDTQLAVFGLHMRRNGSGSLDFTLVDIVVVTYSLPSLNLQAISSLPTPNSPNYGENVNFDSASGYIYAYGTIRNGLDIKHYVARIPATDDLLDATKWEYWHDAPDPLLADGDGDFLPNTPANPSSGADPMFFDDGDPTDPPGPDEAPLAGFSVATNPSGGFLGSALAVDFIDLDDLNTWHATLPEGPWIQDDDLASDLPPYDSGQRTYGGRVVFGITTDPLALWSLNNDSFDAILADPTLYNVIFGPVEPDSLIS